MHVPLTTRDFLRRGALVYGDRVALVDEPNRPDGWGAISYRELAKRADAVGAGLDALGVGVGERVAIVSQNAARFVATLYGVTAAGRVLVPINFRLQGHEVEYIVGHSNARVLLIDPDLDEPLSHVPTAHRFRLDAQADEALFLCSGEASDMPLEEHEIATLNYTSGTTARPKGVCLTHRNLWINATTFGWHAGVSDRDVYLHTLPTFHANGWGMPFTAAGMGVEQVVLRKVDGAEILRRVEKHGVTLMCGAPAVVAAILDAAAEWEGEIPGRGRTRIVVAGAPPPTRTIRAGGDGARLGAHPDLRPHRDVAAADDEPPPRRDGRTHAEGARAAIEPRGRAGHRRRDASRRSG